MGGWTSASLPNALPGIVNIAEEDAGARVCLSVVLGSTGLLPSTSAIKPQL